MKMSKKEKKSYLDILKEDNKRRRMENKRKVNWDEYPNFLRPDKSEYRSRENFYKIKKKGGKLERKEYEL